MADETTVDETTTTTTGAATSETGKDGQTFDAARAQTTIEALRAEVKASKTTAADLAKAQARLKEIDDATKSETDKLASKAQESEAKLTAAEARARDLAIRLAVAETASTIGISGPSVKAAVRLLDTSALEFDDAGSPTNVEAALKALVKEYPMLAAEGDPKKTAIKGTATDMKPATNGAHSDDTLKEIERLRATGRYAV